MNNVINEIVVSLTIVTSENIFIDGIITSISSSRVLSPGIRILLPARRKQKLRL